MEHFPWLSPSIKFFLRPKSSFIQTDEQNNLTRKNGIWVIPSQMFGFYFQKRLFLLKSSCPQIGRHYFFKKALSETRMFGICSKNFRPKTEQSHFPLKPLVRMWKMASYLKVASSFMKDEVFCSKSSHPRLKRSRFSLREEFLRFGWTFLT